MNALVSEGLGFISSHTILEILKKDHKIVIVDNLINSNLKVKNILEGISNVRLDFFRL